jgi:hypothetical protein
MHVFDELVMPELGRQYSDDCLVLSEPCDEPGTTAPNETRDRGRRENPNAPQGVGCQVVGDPLRRASREETGRVGRTVWLLPARLETAR